MLTELIASSHRSSRRSRARSFAFLANVSLPLLPDTEHSEKRERRRDALYGYRPVLRDPCARALAAQTPPLVCADRAPPAAVRPDASARRLLRRRLYSGAGHPSCVVVSRFSAPFAHCTSLEP